MTGAHAQLALGVNSVAADMSDVSLGNTTFAGGFNTTAVGDTATASNNNATALGAQSRAMATSATALGVKAQANAYESLALGADSMATFNNSIALGSGSVTLYGSQIAYTAFGLDTPQSSSGELNVGNRTISTVAPGRADDDAVNVAQLKGVATTFDTTMAVLSARVDGAAMYDRNADGSINHDSITLRGNPANGGTQIHNVADAVDAHDAVNLGQLNALLGDAVGNISNITVNTSNPMFSSEGSPAIEPATASGTHSVAAGANAQASGANSVALGAGSKASADNAVALGQGSVADRANTVSIGAAGQERQITHVAAGVADTDAVNVNQLNQGVSGAIGQSKAYTDDQVRSARRDGYGGAAAAIAMAGLPQAVLPGRGMVAMAAGTYGGQSAMAVGVSQLSETGKWVYKLQGTASTRGELGASIGAGMHW